jgi:predicted Ser/Thr protein kinase
MKHDKALEILNLEVDEDDTSEYRFLVDGKFFKHVTIACGIYTRHDMVRPAVLIPQLPPFPEGDWNEGHIARHPQTQLGFFARYEKVEQPSVTNLWHPECIDRLDLRLRERIRSNIYTATLADWAHDKSLGEEEVVIKFARFPWEMHYFVDETSIYETIEGSSIGPGFYGHLREGDRVTGLVLEHIKDARHAGPEDLSECREMLGRLHNLGILHGDVNRFNFLVRKVDGTKNVTIIDFESARDCSDEAAFQEELKLLAKQLSAVDGVGGYEVVDAQGDRIVP